MAECPRQGDGTGESYRTAWVVWDHHEGIDVRDHDSGLDKQQIMEKAFAAGWAASRTFPQARLVMAKGLKDEGTRFAYVANTACVLLDEGVLPDHTDRNNVAEKILRRIFES